MSKYRFDFTEVKEKLKKDDEKKGFTKDERFWRPVFKDGVCSALIRFLPAPDGTPFVKYLDHSFDYTNDKKEKKKYWKKCINTFGYEKECPICKKSWEYHESAFESDKKEGKKLCRKEHFVCNLHVIKHSDRPDDEGKTFLYDMAPVIAKYKQKMFPTDKDKEAPDFIEFVPCDLFDGADFFLTSKENGKFDNGTSIPSYAESRFMPQKAFMGGDEAKIDAVMDKSVLLDEFIDPTKYPTNDEVIALVGHVFGMSIEEREEEGGGEPEEPETGEGLDNFFGSGEDDQIPDFGSDSTATSSEAAPETSTSTSSSAEDEDDEFFKHAIK